MWQPVRSFFILIVEAHIVAAAMTVLSMNEKPSLKFFPDGSCSLDTLQCRNVMLLAIREVVDKFIDVSYGDEKEVVDTNHDGVHAYACNLLSSGLLYMEFVDAIREGDGNRIIRCWRYFLLHFKIEHRTNYSIEAFTLLAQHHFLFSPRMAMQLTWNRTINIHGRPGKKMCLVIYTWNISTRKQRRA